MRRSREFLFHSFVKPIHLRIRRIGSRLVDHRLGITTTDESVAAILGADIQEFRQTQRALGWTGVWRTIRHVDPGQDDVWLDIGCGAGRIVCGVALRPLDRVIGIDIDGRMVELAEANAAALRGRCTNVHIECADATRAEIDDDVTLISLYNPFDGDLLQLLVDRVIRSLDRNPRRIRIIYANPKEPELLLGNKRFAKSSELILGWRPGEEWKRSQVVQVYEST